MAMPEVKSTVCSAFEPSLKVTLPPGVKEEDEVGLTVAVMLTCCPKTDGFTEGVSVVVVGAVDGVSRYPCSTPEGLNPTPTICPLSLIPHAASSFQFVPGTSKLVRSYITPPVLRNALPPLPSTRSEE